MLTMAHNIVSTVM